MLLAPALGALAACGDDSNAGGVATGGGGASDTTSSTSSGTTSALPAEHAVVGKCTFADATQTAIEPGDVFLYVVEDRRDGSVLVLTGVADVGDALTDATPRQPSGELLPARVVAPSRLEFGGLGADRSGDAVHSVKLSDTSGEVFVSIGTTYGTDRAYPSCASGL